MSYENFKFVKEVQKELILINRTLALLEWDMEVYMPKKGSNSRGEEIAFLQKFNHDKITSDTLFDKMKDIDNSLLTEDEKLILNKFLRDVERSRKIPSELIQELAKETTQGFSLWQEARNKNDFSIFMPSLEKIVELKKKEAKYIGIKGHIYNSLLDSFEEGMTVEKLEVQFEKLKIELINLLDKIKSSEKYKNQKDKFRNKEFSRENQIELLRDVSERIGLDDCSSRIDFAEHPFTLKSGNNDVRITTDIRESPLFSFESTIHESGHALYELNLPEKFELTYLSDAPSFGLHESQSRFWENMVGKSKPFWKFYFEKFKKKFGLDNFEEWYDYVNLVHASKIRIESDEVHYCLHIILRFEIERDLLEGKIEVKDLPRIWNEKMMEFFGEIPKNDKEGILQDVHWSQGYFGYFPTYALGTIYASQIYSAMKKEIPNIEEAISKGDFSKIREWLKESIYKYGNKLLAEEIIKSVCGEGLNIDSYLKYLTKKYSEIYNFS